MNFRAASRLIPDARRRFAGAAHLPKRGYQMAKESKEYLAAKKAFLERIGLTELDLEQRYAQYGFQPGSGGEILFEYQKAYKEAIKHLKGAQRELKKAWPEEKTLHMVEQALARVESMAAMTEGMIQTTLPAGRSKKDFYKKAPRRKAILWAFAFVKMNDLKPELYLVAALLHYMGVEVGGFTPGEPFPDDVLSADQRLNTLWGEYDDLERRGEFQVDEDPPGSKVPGIVIKGVRKWRKSNGENSKNLH